MKHNLYLLLLLLLFCYAVSACKKNTGTPAQTAAGYVTGTITDARGNTLANVKVTIEHTLWADAYVFATTATNGYYKAAIPATPAGDWTAKAQVQTTAYGQDYTL